MEWNKSRLESRTIRTQPVQAEDIGFPFAQQIARVRRQSRKDKKHQNEVVCLVTSLEPERLKAGQWLECNRNGWGIENGLHNRLDVSLNDDRCRIRQPHGMWIMGMFRRLANSLMMEWRSQFHKPQYKSTTDFQSEMGEENLRRAMRFVTSRRPTLKSRS